MTPSHPIWVANAPCSYGAFEIGEPGGPSGLELLQLVADAGYAGIDLGPVGLLGDATTIAAALRNHGLALAGGWIQLPFAAVGIEAHRVALDAVLTIFDAARTAAPDAPPPRPTLADAGAPQRRGMAPGRAARDHSLGLDAAGWETLCHGVEWAVGICRARGYEPAFHPHIATWVEAPWEIDMVMSGTSASLCMDPGHLLTGGDSVAALLGRWGDRIAQVHMKDVRGDIVTAVRDAGGDALDVWKREAFSRFGEGDVDIPGTIATLRERGYAGWIVVEQDVLPVRDGFLERAAADQQYNREVLSGFGI